MLSLMKAELGSGQDSCFEMGFEVVLEGGNDGKGRSLGLWRGSAAEGWTGGAEG